MTPAEKLDRSRLAIIDYLAGREGHREQRAGNESVRDEHAAQHEQHDEEAAGFFSRNRYFRGMSSAARAWWSHHPAQTAVEMATPALRSYMRRRPLQVLALSAGVGALMVVTRPWRLISLTTLVVAIVKSSQLSGVVMSALSDARGWQEQQRGREPHL